VTDDSAIGDDLQSLLATLGEDQEADVLVYPTGSTQDLLRVLDEHRRAGRAEYNPLELAGCIALRARRSVIHQVARRSDVERVIANPTFFANSSD
jgi:hypothetical protein